MYKYFLLSLGILTATFPLRAKPTGFQLVNGDASQPTSPDANTCLIQTRSDAIIHWDGFSSAQGETIRFDQLNASSSVLNRVIGGSESALMGTLLSNGKIYLINPNGVLIGPGAKIEAASFIASTLDILDADFLNQCSLLFSGTSNHSVVNLGQISCQEGQVALIARKVENHGTISAAHAGLGIGAEVLLQIEGEERILIQPSMNSEEEREGTALLNTGSIEALLVELKSGKNPYEKAIQSSGDISATFLHEEGGRVFLVAESGLTEVSGTIDVSNDNGMGGQVHIFGDIVHLTENGSIDASGKSGGGEVLIGGGFQGDPNYPSAQITWAGPETVVKADALENGDGGLVVFWSDNATFHYGNISVKGGGFGGNGGQAEVSAPNLEYRGITDARAPMGQMGNLLLDPNDFVIGALATTVGATFSACPPPRSFNPAALATNQILNTDVNTQLGLCSLTISTVGTGGAGPSAGSILVSSPLSWGLGNTNTLTLTAASFLSISAAITNTSVTAAGVTVMDFSSNGVGAAANAGITLSAGGVLTSSNGNIRLVGNSAAVAAGSHGVNINGGSIVSNSGTISVAGNVPLGPTGSVVGVRLNTVNPITSTSGAINVSGRSQSTGASSHGVSQLLAWTTGTTGLVTFGSTIGTVTGCRGGGNPGVASHGLNIAAAFSTTGSMVGGSVTAINQIIGGAGSGSFGFNNTGTFTGTSAGAINITASTAAIAGLSHGISIAAALSSPGGGNITLIGTSSAVNAAGGGNGVNVGANINSPSGTISVGGITPVGAGGSVLGVRFTVLNGITSTTGPINVSGTSAVGIGVQWTLGWTTGTSGLVSFGSTITDGTVSVTGCRGGTGTSSHGINAFGLFSTGGSVTAINQIIGGTGSGSHGITTTSAFSSTMGGNINITASTNATAGSARGIDIGAALSTTGAGTIRLIGTGPTTGIGAVRGVRTAGAGISSGTGSISVAGVVPAGPTGSGVGVEFANLNPIVTSGPVFVCGRSGSSGASSHGYTQATNWTVVGPVTFGATITDGTVSVTGCQGGSGATSHAINRAGILSSTGAITAINQIVGGSGLASHGVNNIGTTTSTGGGNIFITASTQGTGVSNGIHVASAITATAGGNIRLIGTASPTSGASSRGVALNAVVSSNTGSISIGGAVPAGATSATGVEMGIVNAVTSTSGAIFISGTSAAGGINSHGFSMPVGFTWTPGTSAALTFGSTITDGTISVTGCMGGSGITSNGINIAATLTSANAIIATNQIVGGTGADSSGFYMSANVSTGGGNPIDITASSISSTNGYGIQIFGGNLSTVGAGNITLTGTGSTASTTSYGVYMPGGTGDITTVAGDITITGAGGSVGSPAYGVFCAISPSTMSGDLLFQVAAPSTALGFGTTLITSTTGTITWNAPAEIINNANLNTGNTITLNTVQGPGALTAITPVLLTIDDAMGNTTPLSNILLTSPMITLATSLTADNSITFNGAGLNVDVTASSSASTVGAGGTVSFLGTVNGPSDLTVSTETATFQSTVGAMTPLSALSVTGTTTISVNGNHTVTAGPMSYTGPVVMNSNMLFTNNGAVGTSFSSSITGNFTLDISAPSTTVSIGGTIDTSGVPDANGGTVTISAGGDITISAPILTRGGFPATVSPNGGDVTIISTGGSVSIHDIDASADPSMIAPFGGNGGNVYLQPNSALNATPLGDQPAGFLIFNGTIIFTTGGFMTGVGGAISFSPLGRASPPIAATIYSNFATDEILTLVGASFTMGANEMMTIYGDATLTLTGAVTTSDIISLDTLTINAGSIFLTPRSGCQLLDFISGLYTSPSAHLFSRNAPVFSAPILPAGARTGAAGVPNRTFFKMLLINVDENLALNFDTSYFSPALIQFFEEAIVNEFGVTNSQLSFLLPLNLIWPDWQWPRQGYVCDIKDPKCQKPFFDLETFNIESHEFD